MSGKSDQRARAVAWTAALFDRLRGETERATRIIEAAGLEDGDVAAADRHCRAVANVVRAAKAVCSLLPDREASADEEEGDDDGDDDPAELVRAHAELQSRLDGLRATVEAKRLAGWHVVRAGGEAGGAGRVPAARPPADP